MEIRMNFVAGRYVCRRPFCYVNKEREAPFERRWCRNFIDKLVRARAGCS